MKKNNLCLSVLLSGCVLCSCNGQRWTESVADGYHLITQKDGATLGYSPMSGITIIQQDGYAFKDLNRNGRLDVYEDWRQPIDARVQQPSDHPREQKRLQRQNAHRKWYACLGTDR